MSWLLEKKLKRNQKLREQEERRRQQLEASSSNSQAISISIPLSTSTGVNKKLGWNNNPNESFDSTNQDTYLSSSYRDTSINKRPRLGEIASPQTHKPSLGSSKARSTTSETRRNFRLSLSDDDDDDDFHGDNNTNSISQHVVTKKHGAKHTKLNLEESRLSLSDSDDDCQSRNGPKNSITLTQKISPIPKVATGASNQPTDKLRSHTLDDDDDDDSLGNDELLEFRRLLQQKNQSTNRTSNPSPTSKNVKNKVQERSMKSGEDSISDFTLTQTDSIQESDKERTDCPNTQNGLSKYDDVSSVDEEFQAINDKLNSPINDKLSTPNAVPHNPIALAKYEAQLQASAAVAHHVAGSKDTTNIRNDALWSDSESEQENDEKDSRLKGKAKRKRSSGRRNSFKTNSTPSNTTKYTTDGSIDFWDDIAVLQQHENQILDHQAEKINEQLHPTLDDPKFGPFDLKPLVLTHENSTQQHQVPAALNRYLAPFQQEGVRFMYKCLMNNMGCVLGDDMGCGKTVQVMSLLSALFEKTGTALDVLAIQKRKELVKAFVQQRKRDVETALLQGRVMEASKSQDFSITQEMQLPARWWPVLIVVPPTVLENWQNEFARFTHFSVAIYSDRGRDAALAQVTSGMAEVLLTKRSTYANPTDFQALNSIPVKWKLVVIDEFHIWKSEKSILATNLRKMKSEHRNLVLGMTGTLMSNDHSELWNLIDLVETNYLGDWDEFKIEIAQPIKLARSKTASRDLIEISQAKARALSDKLQRIFIQRSKEDVLKYFLPKKNEKVVMCELSPLQKLVYQHILTLPDVENARTANSPCDCGVNAGFFHRYQGLRTSAERFSYYRENRKQIITRGKCCYCVPLNPDYKEGGSEPMIHPDAVIWRMMKVHANDEACRFCPSCCGLPALAKLYKLGDHLALLQVVKSPGSDEIGSPEHIEFMKSLEFAKVALPHVVDRMPGRSFIRRDGIMDDHFELSGKIKVLDQLLDNFNRDGSRVLLFSYSTQSLDLIQNYLRSRGHRHLRMDGKTANSLRQEMADQFNKDETIFIFLLSTKAMGTGLNLTSANKVIIFDVEWNPSNDEQAQDRAYRIGQTRDVEVLRLVSQGTIDELKYLRQLYKVHLKQETLVDESSAKPRAARLFRGVQGDKYRKGELFGYVNLFRFKDGSFLNDIWKKTGREVKARRIGDLVMHEASKLSDALLGIGSDKVDELLDDETTQIEEMANTVCQVERSTKEDASNVLSIVQDETGNGDGVSPIAVHVQAFDHHDLFREDRGRAAVEEGEEGFDEEMGGATQNLVEIFEEGVIMLLENPQDGSVAEPASGYLNDSSPMAGRSTRHNNVGRNRGQRQHIEELPSGRQIDPPPRSSTKAVDFLNPAPRLEEADWIIDFETDSSAQDNHDDGHSNQEVKVVCNSVDPKPLKKVVALNPSGEAEAKNPEVVVKQHHRVPTRNVRARSTTPQGPNFNIFGMVSNQLKDKETSFSATDLFLPNYHAKRKRKTEMEQERKIVRE